MPSVSNYCQDVISKIDIEKLNSIRNKYTTSDLKYLNYSFEVPYKMTWAIEYLHLDILPPKDILDLGCGPGWFPFIAKHFSHRVKCTDVANSSGNSALLFEEILHALSLKRDYGFSIEPSKKLPSEIGRFDIITALGMAFHHGWHINDWYFFLDDIINNHLKKNITGIIYFQVNRNSAWVELEKDEMYKNRSGIKKWEMFENHMLRIEIKT